MKKQLLFILCLLQVAFVFSQNFPVRVTPQGIPPYPNSLSAYDNTDQLRSPINLLIEFNDLTAASRAVQLKISIEGTNITATSKAVITGAPNITLDAGFPLRLTNAELAPYFALQNLQGVSAQQYNNTLPDGLYRICFEVFDAFNGNKLSNTGCTNIFLVSSDPPFLNRPENRTNLTEQNPTNILFQWTPRHAAVPNVSYEFSLVEIWDRYADPQAVFLASPPIYQDITTATNLLYGPIQPLLLPGKRYAWRVRAIATNAGEEVSVFKNNGYSEIFWFDHASDCTPVSAVQVQDATLTTATISWIGQPEHLDYTIKYREKDGNRWYTKITPRDYITIEEFRPDTVYEFVVLGNCDSESYGESPLQEFRTLTQELAEYTDCGIAPEDVDLSNQELLTELRKNDVFTAGDFPVYVKKVSGSTTFSGEGYISTPWLATVRIPVTFDNIKINTDKKLVDGFVITTYDPNWGSILDADAVIEEATGDPGDKNVIKVDFDIIDVQVSKDGKTVTLIGKDGQEVVREGGKDVVYQDSEDENWEVSADGTVNKSQQADGGPATTETTAGMGGSGVNEITSTEVRIDFEKGNGYYAFDPYPTVTTGTLKDAYTTIDIAGGGTYYPPYKAISNLPGHPTDILLAKATFQNSEYTTEDIVFKTKEGTEIPAEWAGTTATLTLEKKFDFVKEEIIATVKPKDSTQQYTIAGTVNYWHLASQEVTDINVTLVPVNGASLDGIAERINQIYNPAGINFEVTEASSLAISDETIDVGNSTLLSQYTDGEKAWIEQFKALGSYERDTYYLFVTDIPPTDADTDGFMPLKRQFGFVFAGQDKGRTAAHELGHGVFGLEHTFTEYNTDQGATSLLMDYGSGTAFTHMDWEKMHAPGLQLYWFQEDEDGENYSTRGYFKDLQFGQNDDSNKTFTFLTPSQELLVLPNNVSNVTKFYGYYGNSLFDDLSKFNQFMTVVPGTIAKFTVEDKTYKARIVELGENEYSLKEYSTDNGEVYELSDYNIELNEKNSAKAIIFGVHESDRYSYHALIINGNYSHFSENSRIVPVKDFIVQIDAETQTKSLDIQYSGSQYSITNEAVNWVFAEANYSTSDKTFLLRNKILELKSLYPRLLDEISSQFGNWNRQNLCSGGGKFELLLRQEYCDPQTSQREGTTSYSIKTDADISDSAESWLSKFYDYLKANVNNEANNIASSLLDYKTIPGKIEEDNSQSIAYVINIASQNDIGQLSAETILKIISKFVNETFTQESNRAKYDLEGAIIKLIQYANKNINKPIIEGIEKPNILNPDKVLSEQIFYAVDDAFLFFGSDNKNVLIRELTKKMFDSQELYDARLSDAINDIEKRSFVFEYTNVVGRALVEIGNISSEQLTYGFIEAPLSDYYQTETINKDFITDKNDSNFGKIKLTQLTQSGFRNIEYSNEDNFQPFDLIFLTNRSNLTSAKAFESGVGFDPKIYPIPAIAVAYVSQSGENQTTADGIFTVIDVASLAVSGGALNIATNLTRARRIFYTADVISSMASIGATSVSDNAELNELKNILQITSALSGIVSLGDNVSNINFKNLLITAKNKVDEAEEIASDIRKLSQNINQLSDDQLGVFVSSYEKVTDDYIGYAIKDLQDAKHANDAEAVKQIKQALTKVLDAKSEILQINVKAEQLLSDARRVEEVVTSDISNIASSKSGIMEGLEFRLKTKSSLVRKLFVDGVNTPMNDVLRYTTTFEAESFTDGVFDVMKALQQKGYEVVNIKNTFEGGAVYKGINTNLREPSGQVFELQFHTPKSLDVKQTINHPLYEEYRILDPTTPRAQELFQEMVQNSSKIPKPGNVQNITYESLKLSGSHLDLLSKLKESSLAILKNKVDGLDDSFKTEFFEDFAGASKDKLQKLQDKNLLLAWKENLRSVNLEELLISKTNSGLREEYAAKVEALADKKIELLNEGKSIEEVAKTLQEMRRSLTIEYKDYTPSDFLDWIFKRNEITYTQTGKGDKWGATYEGLIKTNAKKKFGINDLNLLNQSQWNEINESIAKSSSFNFGGTKKELGTNFYDFFTDKVSSSELQELEKILIKYRMR